jgi:hypothetical protein
MKFHRINDEIVEIRSQSDTDRLSPSSSSQLLLSVLQDNAPDSSDPLKRTLPFQPRSYRDFMLFEAHYYGVAMGLTKLYRPLAHLAARLYAAVLGSPLPLLKPHALWYQQPIFYQSNHLAFYADGTPVHYPKYASYLDVELELGIVLGRPLFNATAEEARDAIAGFCVLNDFSARNVQMDEMARWVPVPVHHVSEANG